MNNGRKYIIQGSFILTGLVFLIKLFFLQVTDSTYAKVAENNIILTVIEYPYRGLIYDRNKKLLVYNSPQYDIEVVPHEVTVTDTLAFCQVFGITKEEFVSKIDRAKAYSYVKPSIFIKQITNLEFASLQNHIIDYPGFQIQARTVRAYTEPVLANSLGFIGEISKKELEQDTLGYYKQGDYIGKSGIESSYEQYLRGKRGVRYKIKNVRGVEKGSFQDGKFDTLAVAGEILYSTIDLDLQLYAEKLLDGKVGSIVAIEPSSGEILTIVSRPSYDPAYFTGRKFSERFAEVTSDTSKPLFNRPIMAMYPPGSIFKTLQALIGLQEKVIDPNESIYVDGSLIGDHAPPGYYDLNKAIKISSNNYFFMAFRKIINQKLDDNTYIDSRIGLDKWRKHLANFGLGQPLGIDIPNEKGGLIPGSDYYDNIYSRNRWKFSTIASLSIGQGEMLFSPLQMANLTAILANRGYFYTPHIIKEIEGSPGYNTSFLTKRDSGIDSVHFPLVIDAMEEALRGTAWRAIIPGIAICGKTGTAENPHGEDHSVFMAFAPKDDPKIAISVYVENSGWGGRAAASTASLVIEKYLKGEISKKWLEDYVLKGDFLDAKE